MTATEPLPGQLTLHIILGTVPQKQEALFDEKIRKEYYDKFRDNSVSFSSDNKFFLYHPTDVKTKIPLLFNPLRYYILGNYDIAYISLINNLKFAQRLFESAPSSDGVFAPHTFQSFTGITHHDESYLRDFFYRYLNTTADSRKFFIGICNLKLNNGFLIGNGNIFINPVIKKITNLINAFNKDKSDSLQIDFLIEQSFSWFEFSLLLFTDNTESIAGILTQLRRLSVKELDNFEEITNNSLYRVEYPDEKNNDLAGANVFADTHTYIGLHADLIDNVDKPTVSNRKFVQRFTAAAPNIKLKTDIEWQVKPGHMPLLMNLLTHTLKDVGQNFKLDSRYLLTGKSDYLLQENNDSILTNYKLMKLLFNGQSDIFSHVRKVRTKVLFEKLTIANEMEDRKSFALQPLLQRLAIKGSIIQDTDQRLKALKISRQIKSKIIKIFSSFNNGIQDVILFPFFLDFKVFIDELVSVIKKEHEVWDKSAGLDADSFFINNKESFENDARGQPKDIHSVNEVERKLIQRINVFEEAYNLRMLNCYQFEDITDFDLDFNGSVQQLLSAYSSLIIETGNIFYDPEKKYRLGPVVQLNLKDTQANYNSINYHVHHLISPEFVFATVTKEILNNENYDANPVISVQHKYRESVRKLEKEDPYLYEMISDGTFDFSYFINDVIRFSISYDMDFKLFYYWFWMYNLQNPLLYDKRGMMNERHFAKELFRILLVCKHFGININEVYCPVEELYTYWDRHYRKVNTQADNFLKFLKSKGLNKEFMEYFAARFHNFLDILIPEDVIKETKSNITREKSDMLRELAKRNEIGFSLKKYYYLRKIYEENERKPLAALEGNSLVMLQYFMKRYLEDIYKENNGTISFLRRDWHNGRPLSCFIKANSTPHTYSADQTGGVFFDNMEALNRYIQRSGMVLNRILHYSVVLKKNFIIHKQNNKPDEI